MRKKYSRILIIFDESVSLCRVKKAIGNLPSLEVCLFPLTSRWGKIYAIEKELRQIKNITLKRMGSAEKIDEEVDRIKTRIHGWARGLGTKKILGKSLIEWFFLPDSKTSTWWFSLVQEKNNLKTDTFFKIAQTQTLDGVISSGGFDLVVFSLKDVTFANAVKGLCEKYSVKHFSIFRSLYKRSPYFAKRVIFLSKSLAKAFISKMCMTFLRNRIRNGRDPVLFVSYFPNVDMKAARGGILKNNYAETLQKKLSSMDKNIIWCWMYVPVNGVSFVQAVKMARRFLKNGYINFFLDEFIGSKVFFGSIKLWIRQRIIYRKLREHLSESFFCEGFAVPEASGFINDLMDESFLGRTAVEGILYYELFKECFKKIDNAAQCIYYLEMHAWEKALNLARRAVNNNIRTIGFQHAGFSENYFFYFTHPDEVSNGEKGFELPVPDILACNGDVPLSALKNAGHSNIRKVESVRYLYLRKILDKKDKQMKENIVLIAGSINEKETEGIMSLFLAAYNMGAGFKVWIKEHPALPVKGIFKKWVLKQERSSMR